MPEPFPGDDVVTDGTSRVYVDPEASVTLADQRLDVEPAATGTAFTLGTAVAARTSAQPWSACARPGHDRPGCTGRQNDEGGKPRLPALVAVVPARQAPPSSWSNDGTAS